MERGNMKALQVIDDFNLKNGSVVSEEKMTILAGIWSKESANNISWEEFENNIEISSMYYKSIKSADMAGGYCSLMHLQGSAAEYVHKEFRKLDSRLIEAGNQELTLFPPYRMQIFNFISNYLLFAINIEGILVAVIVTLYSTNFEKSNHTSSTVYGTRRGNRILKDKLLASVTGSLFCFVSIIVTTFLAAICIFPVDTIMDTLLSNPLVNLNGLPCITNSEMVLSEYIFISLGMSSLLAIIFSLGSFAVGIRVKNSYYAFGIISILLGILRVFSTMAPRFNYLFFWTQYNPIDLILKAGRWFLYNSTNFSPPGYEGYTTVIWFAICLVGCILGLQSLDKKRAKL